MDKEERKRLSDEREAILSRLAAIAEVRRTPGTSADPSQEPALRARLAEVDALLRG